MSVCKLFFVFILIYSDVSSGWKLKQAAILCPELNRVRNGNRLFQDTSGGIRNDYESVTEYTCKRGYYLNGDTEMKVYKRTCQADGTWGGKEPICDVPRCKQISDFYNGTIRYFGDRNLYSQAFYRCEDAFSLFPKDVDMSECEDTLKWKPDPPKCYRNVEKKIPANGYGIPGGQSILLHTESYKVCCNKGYELKNDSQIGGKCMEERIRNYKGSLVPNVPDCVEERCDPADLKDAVLRYKNGETVKTKITSRTNVYLSCRDGYDYYYSNGLPMTKPMEKECIQGRIENAPQCEKKKCQLSGLPNNKDTFYRIGQRNISADQYIDHGSKVRVYCRKESEYELFVNSTQTYLEEEFSTKCKLGQFDKRRNDFPICVEKRCSFDVSNGLCLSMDDGDVCKRTEFKMNSGSTVQLTCENGYKLYRSKGRRYVEDTENKTVLRCSKGRYPKDFQCIPDSPTESEYSYDYDYLFESQSADTLPVVSQNQSCTLSKDRRYRYEDREGKKIKPGSIIYDDATLHVTCTIIDLDEYYNSFYYDEYNTDLASYPTITCANNTLSQLELDCPEVETCLELKHGDVTMENGYFMVSCDKGYSLNLIIHEDPKCTCKHGTLRSVYGDQIPHCIPDSPTESENGYDYDYLYESQSADTLLVDSQSQSKNDDKGCTLSKDRRYRYEDREGKKIKPGSVIYDETTLHVTCTIIYLDEYFNSYYDDDYNTDLASYPTISCANNTLSQLELDCPEVETCQELKHGDVTMENGYFMVSCDKGYSLNLTISEDPKCTCKHGTLRSVYGDQIPHCIPDNCKIPYEFDGRLSVTNKNSVSLSRGSVLAVGEFVYLNCSKAVEPNYEPLNRRFSCSNGMWTEAESRNWKLGFNGEFPKCRAAICEPNCTNGGVCYKDDTCRCQHLTEGNRCENVICDNKCYVNGGKCVGPGICGDCPQGKFGKNCEQDGCLLPKDAAKYKNSQTVFSPGETLISFSCPIGFILSSRDGMTCQDDGWSNIVKCVEAAVYLISVKTGNKRYSGTDAKVYITLHGLRGSTDRIYLQGSFEADDLDETRVPRAKDVRPITSVEIGHDGSGIGHDWYLEYVSIYVENTEEYYVFGHNDWVVAETDIDLPRQGIDQQRCIASFDSGHSWLPRWKSIGRKDMHYLKDHRDKSLRGCKQACINLQTMTCVAVSYDNHRKTCWGLAVSDRRYFDVKDARWNSPVYLRTCKQFD